MKPSSFWIFLDYHNLNQGKDNIGFQFGGISKSSTMIEIMRSALNKATWGRISFKLGILIFEDSASNKVSVNVCAPSQ